MPMLSLVEACNGSAVVATLAASVFTKLLLVIDGICILVLHAFKILNHEGHEVTRRRCVQGNFFVSLMAFVVHGFSVPASSQGSGRDVTSPLPSPMAHLMASVI